MEKKATKKGMKNTSRAMTRTTITNDATKQTLRAPGAPSKSVDELKVSTLVRNLGQMIESARRRVAVAANEALTTLYWQLGHRVLAEVLQGRRAEYGAQIVETVGRQFRWTHLRSLVDLQLRRYAPDGSIQQGYERKSEIEAFL